MTSDLARIEDAAHHYFGDVTPAHDWFHVQRVYATAETLARAEGAALDAVRVATLLHDIGRAREDDGAIDDHAAWGAREAAVILREFGYGEDFIDTVTHCIRSHRYSTSPEPGTIEAKVLSDADNLDALGATGIARAFTYGGEHGTPIADPDLPAADADAAEGPTTLTHLETKILRLKDRMYTASGRDLAEGRHRFVAAFMERFTAEMDGRV